MCYFGCVKGSVLVWQAILLGWLSLISSTLACPSVCFCNKITKISYCSRKNLPFIPEGIPSTTLQLNLNLNVFENHKLVRENFTTFKDLQHLYLNGCGIEEIGVGTFADLKNLQWLDISSNNIKKIEDFTFSGLVLEQLFLSENVGLQISAKAFENFGTKGLFLHGSKMKEFSLNSIGPLNGTLQSLWLDDNNFERLSIDWLYVFRKLSHVRLGHNPFHCNCELTWLWDFYSSNDSIIADSIPPSCTTPPRLKGKFFSDMTRDEFNCELAVFSKVDISLHLNEGQLNCVAQGDPTPSVVWINPHGEEVVFGPPLNDSIKENSGILTISRSTESTKDHYQCIARNPAGDVSVVVDVAWPPIPEPKVIHVDKDGGEHSELPYDNWHGYEPSQMGDTSAINATPAKEVEEKNFTIVQLVCSIIGTFLLSLLLCIILFHFYYKHQADVLFREANEREKTPDNVYITSDLDGEQAIKMINHHHHHHYATPSGPYDPQVTPS